MAYFSTNTIPAALYNMSYSKNFPAPRCPNPSQARINGVCKEMTTHASSIAAAYQGGSSRGCPMGHTKIGAQCVSLLQSSLNSHRPGHATVAGQEVQLGASSMKMCCSCSGGCSGTCTCGM